MQTLGYTLTAVFFAVCVVSLVVIVGGIAVEEYRFYKNAPRED